MPKVITAKELICSLNKNNDEYIHVSNVENIAKIFARLHVREALKQAAKKADYNYNLIDNDISIDNLSILEAYDINNII